MPTITISKRDLEKLTRRTLPRETLLSLLAKAKAELEKQQGDEITVQFNDTNLPYLWSVEGLARFFRGCLGVQKGVPALKLARSAYTVKVDKSVKGLRPFIAGFVAKGPALSEDILLQVIQLQEKLADSFGRRRQKLSIGLYPSTKITFPITYAAVPETKEFIPLGYDRPMSVRRILDEHPKGKEYGWILKGMRRYPCLIDAKGEVLSLPPVINSQTCGKLEPGIKEMFFDATGTDEDALLLACNIFAYALAERGYTIHPVQVIYPGKRRVTPDTRPKKASLPAGAVRRALGLDLSPAQIKRLLERALYTVRGASVEIPAFRQDVLHAVDIVEDVAIQYGYENMKGEELTTFTRGSTFPIVRFINQTRALCAGLGYQEVLSALLSSHDALYTKMGMAAHDECVGISEYMSASYSVVRSWIVPVLLDVLAKNQHVNYPQRVFEQGLVTLRDGGKVWDEERLALASAHPAADFTEGKQVIDYLLRVLGVRYTLKDAEHASFIPGRCVKILAGKKHLGWLGEVHPRVLANWKIEMPVVAMELNLSLLHDLR